MAKTNGCSYSDLDHLAKLGTHRLRHNTPRIVQGKVFKEGSRGSRKIQMTEPEKCDRSVSARNWAGKTIKGYKINSSIVGAPTTPDRVPAEVKALQLKNKRLNLLTPSQKDSRTESGKVCILMERILLTNEPETSTVTLVAPDGSEHKEILSEVYPV